MNNIDDKSDILGNVDLVGLFGNPASIINNMSAFAKQSSVKEFRDQIIKQRKKYIEQIKSNAIRTVEGLYKDAIAMCDKLEKSVDSLVEDVDKLIQSKMELEVLAFLKNKYETKVPVEDNPTPKREKVTRFTTLYSIPIRRGDEIIDFKKMAEIVAKETTDFATKNDFPKPQGEVEKLVRYFKTQKKWAGKDKSVEVTLVDPSDSAKIIELYNKCLKKDKIAEDTCPGSKT